MTHPQGTQSRTFSRQLLTGAGLAFLAFLSTSCGRESSPPPVAAIQPATNSPALVPSPAPEVAIKPIASGLRYVAQPRGSKVTIAGTSSIHDWTVEGAVIGGFFEVEPAFVGDRSLKSVPSLNDPSLSPLAEVVIPIRSLKSGKELMDGIMQDAMKMKDHASIKYRLGSMQVKGDVSADGTPVKFDTRGELTVSGVTKPCPMEVELERMDEGRLKFTGGATLKMTDFDIVPPSPKIPGLGSLITTGDEVVLTFEWVVAPGKRPASN